MLIVETTLFTRLIQELMSDDEYKDLQAALVNRPDLGDLIKDSGGIRKVRWNLEGAGKSGGIRAIYYWVVNDDHIRMLYVYPKGKKANLTKAQVAQLKVIVKEW